MTDTLTTAKSLTKQTVGGNSGTWGTILNSTLDLIDKGLGQTLTKSISGNVTLTSTEAQNIGYDFTGTLSADAAVTWPTFYGPAIIRNKTTGGFAITAGLASGSTVRVEANRNVLIFSDGADFVGPHAVGTTYDGAPSDPATTVSNAAVMMGLGAACTITPRRSGAIRFAMDFGAIVGAINGGWTGQLRYGTGSAPGNGVAGTGIAIGVAKTIIITDQQLHPMALSAVVTGLTAGTAYWFDLAVGNAAGSSTAGVQQIHAEAVEL